MLGILIYIYYISICFGEDVKIEDHLETSRPRCEYRFSVPARDFGYVCQDLSVSTQMEELKVKIENVNEAFIDKIHQMQKKIESESEAGRLKLIKVQQELAAEVSEKKQIQTQIKHLENELHSLHQLCSKQETTSPQANYDTQKTVLKTNSSPVVTNATTTPSVENVSPKRLQEYREIEKCNYNFTNIEKDVSKYEKSLPVGLHLFGVRLTYGSYGNVEVLLFGEWGSVCDDSWNLKNAHVVCRELGFQTALRATVKSHFGRGTGPIWFDNVRCTGSEGTLLDCTRARSDTIDCGHNEDAGVVCSGIPVRLTNDNYGRVEVLFDKRWGTICNDWFDLYDARVVCKQMGYLSATQLISSSRFAPGRGHIHMTRVVCSGNENSIFECEYEKPNESRCNHQMDVAIECAGIMCDGC